MIKVPLSCHGRGSIIAVRAAEPDLGNNTTAIAVAAHIKNNVVTYLR